MKLGFEESQSPYNSGAQSARVWTEGWVRDWLFCPSCGNAHITKFAANRPVADFHCTACAEEFELKSQKRSIGRKLVDGAYRTMQERLAADNNPNLLVLSYDLPRLMVTNVVLVPRQFFVPTIIEPRKPLSATARRAGWTGCNILLDRVPAFGKIFLVRDELPQPKDLVLAQWRRMLFLREESPEARGWMIEVLKCVEAIGRDEFSLDEVYAFERQLSLLYPNNHHVRQKIRQQLQVLRDHGLIDFVDRGRYRLRGGIETESR
jgi:type II restriction enzyme